MALNWRYSNRFPLTADYPWCRVIKQFDDILSQQQLQQMTAWLEKTAFVDGAATAGTAARRVKNNLQAQNAQPGLEQARALFGEAVLQNAGFRDFALPLRAVPPLFSRYETGMRYGDHTDNALMSNVRTDLALTLFLNAPDSYDGGELVIETDREARTVKLKAGSAILYPATSIHRVEPVTRGRRDVAVTWIQSMVRDAAQREIITDLGAALAHARSVAPDARETLLIAKTRSNLLRMWANT